MGIRFPLKAVLSYSSGLIETGPASTLGGVAKTFTLPQDTDNVVVRFTASVTAGGASATFQTTPDGGTTWYDVQRTSTISYAGNSVAGGGQTHAEWLSIPVISGGFNPQVAITQIGQVTASSVMGGTIGAAAASTLGQKQISGLPILGAYNRIFLRYTAAVTSIQGESVTVYVNSQSGTK